MTKGITMQIRFIRTVLFTLVVLSMSAASFAQIGVAIRIGPPALPVYEQPLCPGDGYLWTPGYWGYDYDVTDYYWVPRHMGDGTGNRFSVDSRLLGLGWRRICFL